jgi:hypothetical protein
MNSNNKELATQDGKSNLPSTEVQAWGQEVNVGSDLLIPKLWLMQGMSEAVNEGKAQVGDWVDSLNFQKFGSLKEPVEVIPFHVVKMWDILTEQEDGQFKWTKSEPIIESPLAVGYNDNLPWNDVLDGKPIKRVRRLNFFVLIPKEVEAGVSIPYVVSFKSTTLKEGQKMLNQMYVRNQRAKLPPAGYKFKLAVGKAENEKGKWFVPQVELGARATQEEVSDAFSWYKMITGGSKKVVVDESDVQGSEETQVNDTGEY